MEYATKETIEVNCRNDHMTQPPVWGKRRRFAQKIKNQTKKRGSTSLKVQAGMLSHLAISLQKRFMYLLCIYLLYTFSPHFHTEG